MVRRRDRAATDEASPARGRSPGGFGAGGNEAEASRMLIFDRENWRHHRPWSLAVAAATLATSAWYVLHGYRSGAWDWPGGFSPPGFAYGVAGGLIILFEMLLWPRKWLRGLRLGRAKTWMTLHIWLGLLTLPLLLLHGGFHFDPSTSPLAAVLMWLLVIVVGSGIFGVAVQNVVPRLMLERLPAETIAAQIGHVLAQYRDEAERMVRATSGEPPADGPAGAVVPAPPSVAIETVRQVAVGRVQGRAVASAAEARNVPGSERLLAFHRDRIDPYLRAKSGAGHELASPRRAASLFQALKAELPDDAEPVVDRLADLCDQRRQFDLQLRMHRWLFAWLAVHVALSVALFVLMIAHIFLALKYV